MLLFDDSYSAPTPQEIDASLGKDEVASDVKEDLKHAVSRTRQRARDMGREPNITTEERVKEVDAEVKLKK